LPSIYRKIEKQRLMSQLNLKSLLAGDNVSQVVEKINYNFQQIVLNGGGPQGDPGFIGPPGIPGPEGPIGLTGPHGPTGSYIYLGITGPTSGYVFNPPYSPGDVFIQTDNVHGAINFFEAGPTSVWHLVDSINTLGGYFSIAYNYLGSTSPDTTTVYPNPHSASQLLASDLTSLGATGQILVSGQLASWLDQSVSSWTSLFGGLENQIRILNTDPVISGTAASARIDQGAGMLISLKSNPSNADNTQILSIETADLHPTVPDKFFYLSANGGASASLVTDTSNRVAIYAPKDFSASSINYLLADSLTVFGSSLNYDANDSSFRIDTSHSSTSYSRFFISKGSSFSTGVPVGEWEFRLGNSSDSTDQSLRIFGTVNGSSDKILEMGVTSTNGGYLIIGGTETSLQKGKARLTVIGSGASSSGSTASALLGEPQIVDFQTSGGTSMFTLDSGGNVVSGIRFGNTQYDSSDAYTLDHYQKGSWTPVLNPEGYATLSGWTAGAYKVNKANFTRIGNVAKVDFSISVNNLPSPVVGGTMGNMFISGFPFKPDFENISGTVSNPANPLYPLVALKTRGLTVSPGPGQGSGFGDLTGGFVLANNVYSRLYLYDTYSNLVVDNIPSGATSTIFGSFEYFISSLKDVPVVISETVDYSAGATVFNVPLLPQIYSDSPLTSVSVSGLPGWMAYNSGSTSIGFAVGTTMVPGPTSTYNISVVATNVNGSGSGTVSVYVTTAPPVPVVKGPASVTQTYGTPQTLTYTATNSPLGWTSSPFSVGSETFTYVGSTATLILGATYNSTSSLTISATNSGGTGSTTTNVSMIYPLHWEFTKSEPVATFDSGVWNIYIHSSPGGTLIAESAGSGSPTQASGTTGSFTIYGTLTAGNTYYVSASASGVVDSGEFYNIVSYVGVTNSQSYFNVGSTGPYSPGNTTYGYTAADVPFVYQYSPVTQVSIFLETNT